MTAWFEHNWWWLLSGVGAILYFTIAALRAGRGAQTLPKRMLYTVFPQFHPDSYVRRRVPLGRVVVLTIIFLVGVVVVMAAMREWRGH